MAETLLPSVRGRTRTVVAVLALTAATASGALLGLAAGVVALPLRWLGPMLAALPALPVVPASLVGGSPAGALAVVVRALPDIGSGLLATVVGARADLSSGLLAAVVGARADLGSGLLAAVVGARADLGSGLLTALVGPRMDLGSGPGSGPWALAGSGPDAGSPASGGLSLPLPLPLALALVLVLVLVGLAFDVVMLASGRLRPLSLGRQVPREWGRWLRPEVVAVLYGARLGAGPSTMLSTWTWWSVTVGAALVGPGTAAATGACFGLTRIVVTVLVSSRLGRRPFAAANSRFSAEFPSSGVAVPAGPAVRRRLGLRARHSAPFVSRYGPSRGRKAAAQDRLSTTVGPGRAGLPWFASLGRRPRVSWAMVDALVLLVAVSVVVTSCASTQPQAPPVATTGVDSGPSSAGGAGSGDDDSLTDPRLVPPPSLTTPAQLEDFVRPPSPAAAPAPGSAGSGATTARGRPAAAAPVPATPEALAAALLAIVPGFEPVAEPGADRFLDLEAAAGIQPDPGAETALLQTRGFEGGWTRAFRNPTNDVVVASVYQFEDDAEAEFYLEDGLITIGGYGGRFFDIAALPGVRGFHQSLPADGAAGPLTVLGAAFQAGPRWYLVYVLGAEATVTPPVLIDAVTAQRQAAASS